MKEKVNSLGQSIYSNNSNGNGNIISWQASEESKQEFAQKQNEELERIKKKKMMSSTFLYTGLE